MENPKLNLSLDFQNSTLNLMLKDESFALKCLTHLSAEYFENKYLAWTFNKIKNHFEQYRTVPSRAYIVDQLKTVTDNEQESYKKAIKSILSASSADLPYLKDELTTFIQTSEFKKMHLKVVDIFNANQYKESYDYVTEQINKINKISFIDDSYVRPVDIDKILKEVNDSKLDYLPSGIPLLDDALNGGLPKKSVTTVLGAWNTGKSIFSINMAYFAAKSGKKILYVFHEGRKEQVVTRFISRITGIPYNELMAGDWRDDELKVKKIEDSKVFIENHLRIREMREVGISVEDVYRYCVSTMREWPFDAFFDDYGQKLTTSKKMHSKELRHVLGHIWNTFDLMSAELNIAVVTLAQVNRESVRHNRKGSAILRSEGVSEAAQIAHVSETILTLNRSAQDESDNKLVVCLDKCRDSRAGLLIGCVTNMRSMKSYDPQLGFTNDGWDLGNVEKEDE